MAGLRTALTAEGLEVVDASVRMGVGVAPLAGGPTWGMNGGLAVALYTGSAWELMLNSHPHDVPHDPAPATEAGASEVARLVHGVLRGDVADPFRRTR